MQLDLRAYRRPVRFLVLAIGLSAFVACGDDGEAPTEPEPAPVASVEVTPAQFELRVDETQELSVTLTDAQGNVLSDRSVSFESSDPSVAEVSSDGVVTGVSTGSATITATSEGQSGTAEATVVAREFAPEEDMTLSGENTFESVSVPEDVTVTLSEDTEVTVNGTAEIQGEISGDCTGFDLSGENVIVGGTVRNDCSQDTDSPPDLRLVSENELVVDGAGLASSGDVVLTNDSALSELPDSAFDELPQSVSPLRQAGGPPCVINAPVPVVDADEHGQPGDDGTTAGEGGQDGGDWKYDCKGNVNITGTGGGKINVPDGGDGGKGVDNNVTGDKKVVNGGAGGNGGNVRIRATGNIRFQQGPNGNPFEIELAHGGDGGDAEFTAASPGGSAGAKGGDGGDSGTLNVRANGGIDIGPNGLEIVVGDGGDGGDATARAADGMDAGSEAAQKGGDAMAEAGDGGDTPDAQLRARGDVTGAGNIQVTGGQGGAAGTATVRAGNGGDGNEDFPPGAEGGSMEATGGDGGDARARDLDGSLVGDGGTAGSATFLAGGNGGTGWNGCTATPTKEGGNGGEGGSASGSDGAPGTGANAGGDGEVKIEKVGVGGDGGDGDGPGSGGSGGTDNTAPKGGATVDPDAFTDGADGDPCPNVDTSGVPPSFNHNVGQTQCPQPVGEIVISNPQEADADLSWSVQTGSPLQLVLQGQTSTTLNGTLQPGQSITVVVQFDCSQTSSFTQDVDIEVEGPDGTKTESLSIEGNVN